jgi:pSer/pThr/pTyr-binding forkhead associated (FHA) protein
MVEATLTIHSSHGTQQFSLIRQHIVIGRSEEADISLDDRGLSSFDCSIHRQDDRIWILNENSKNGCYVNGEVVPTQGLKLSEGDKISLGHYTTIWISIAQSDAHNTPYRTNGALFTGILLIALAVLTGAAVLAQRVLNQTSDNERASVDVTYQLPSDQIDQSQDKRATGNSNKTIEVSEALERSNSSADQARTVTQEQTQRRKLYLQMSESEQNEFVYSQARNISRMMSNREYVFTDDVLPLIKRYVDGYARRVGNQSNALWGEDLNRLLTRARNVAPEISRAFNSRGVPKVVGLYIPMIESEYRECLTSPVGAKGLFQFMPATASGYGVNPNDRCDVKKMAPAAARYLKDRIAEFGSDSMSVALGIAGYNRSPDSVRRDLSDVINSKNKERSFWTLVANSNKLDRFFQNENIKYVPKFFAAAIVGENPWAFGLQMNPLSSYSEPGPESGRKN